MTGAQAWAVIGIFAATLFALAGVVVTLIDAKINGLRNELLARFDSLERDVQRLFVRAFEQEPPQP